MTLKHWAINLSWFFIKHKQYWELLLHCFDLIWWTVFNNRNILVLIFSRNQLSKIRVISFSILLNILYFREIATKDFLRSCKNFACFAISCPQGTSTTQSVTASFVTVTWTAAEHLQRAQVKLAKERDPLNIQDLKCGFLGGDCDSRVIEWKDQDGNLLWAFPRCQA